MEKVLRRVPRLLFVSFLFTCTLIAGVQRISAQVQPPDRKYLYNDDRNQKVITRQLKAAERQRKASSPLSSTNADLPLDIDAPNLHYDASGKEVQADGGVTIRYGNATAVSDSGSVNIEDKSAELSGNVRISDPSSKVSADKANINLKTGQGTMENADVFFEDGEYRLKAVELGRAPEDVYTLKDCELSTCNCPTGGKLDWTLDADHAKVQRNGYGQAWGAWLDVKGVPVFYFPYIIFPAKTERQTGFLPVSFGTSSQDGFRLETPFFINIDRSTDATITPLIQTKTRVGGTVEFRKAFSLTHSTEMSLLYVNEAARNGELRGTNIDGLADPTFDENRIEGYLRENWSGQVGTNLVQFIVDGNYISDDLLLREIENDKIGPYNSRFVTSTGVLRTSLFDTYSLDLSTEFNQSLVSNDDFVFQRLPSLTLSGFQTFRPEDENPYGTKLIVVSSADITNFSRTKSYEGQRAELYERARVPFHFQNYFDGEAEANIRASEYDLSENAVFSQTATGSSEPVSFLQDSSDRAVPTFLLRTGTVLEKVFDVEDDSWIKKISELGTWGRNERLARLKHTLEPNISYKYVPFVDQSDTPQFDSTDHLAKRNVVTYQLTQRLYARYEPRDQYLYGVEEVAPEVSDFGSLQQKTPLDSQYAFGFDDTTTSEYQELRRGSMRELATFNVSQSYDIAESFDNRDPKRGPFSDIKLDLTLLPNDHIGLHGITNYNADDQDFDSYGVEAQLFDKRGDQIRSRLTFVSDSVRQLETGLELAVLEDMKVGYYSRYDDLTGEFIENKVGLRFLSNCHCWVFDIEMSDKVNPDETRLTFNVTLIGLGEFGDTFLSKFANRTTQSDQTN